MTKKELEVELERVRELLRTEHTNSYDRRRDSDNKARHEHDKLLRDNNFLIPKFKYDEYNWFHQFTVAVIGLLMLVSLIIGIVIGANCNESSSCEIDPDRVVTTYNPLYRLGHFISRPLGK